MRRRLLSLKVLAFCRRAISSKRGWRHKPGEGVEVEACRIWAWGVEGFVVVDAIYDEVGVWSRWVWRLLSSR
jgi:hypothetical protein